MTGVVFGCPTVVKSQSGRNGPWGVQSIMDVLLTNCSKCNKLMVQSVSMTICRHCFLEGIEERESSGETNELPDEQNTCRNCGAELDENEMFCARCQLRFLSQARSAIEELSEKLARSPKLGGRASDAGGQSRFHSRDSALRQLGRRAGKRSYTPSTKYST